MRLAGFDYRRDALYCEEVALEHIAARAGTPCYVYSSRGILESFSAYDQGLAGLPHRVCYAVKANSSLAVLALLDRAGAGFDIVSGGELFRVLAAGAEASRVVFSGVGKTAPEIEYALDSGICCFNAESEAELGLIDALAARRSLRPRVGLRVNPDVDAATHPYISTGLRQHKFGIALRDAEAIFQRAAQWPHLSIEGVSCHIGSQLLDTAPLEEALHHLLDLAARVPAVRFLDLGGGVGVPYQPEQQAPDVTAFLTRVRERLAGHDWFFFIEPGRSIVAEAGVLLTRVLYRKNSVAKEFVVVDAAMNDLIRPSLYEAHHEILPVRRPARGKILADVVGPVCETGDFLALDREMDNVLPGDLLAVATAGAYCFVAASNYNSRPRPPEILVEGLAWRTIRARESYPDLIRGEQV